jgi:hypothetical protein
VSRRVCVCESRWDAAVCASRVCLLTLQVAVFDSSLDAVSLYLLGVLATGDASAVRQYLAGTDDEVKSVMSEIAPSFMEFALAVASQADEDDAVAAGASSAAAAAQAPTEPHEPGAGADTDDADGNEEAVDLTEVISLTLMSLEPANLTDSVASLRELVVQVCACCCCFAMSCSV